MNVEKVMKLYEDNQTVCLIVGAIVGLLLLITIVVKCMSFGSKKKEKVQKQQRKTK